MKFFWFYFLLCEIERRERENNSDTEHQHSRYQKRFHRSLSVEDRRLRQQKIPRESLHFIHESSWRRLFYSYNNQSLITLTGLDHGTFDYLLRKFQPIFESRTPFGLNGDGYGDGLLFGSRKGRKRKVTAMDCLGIVLAWTRTRGSTYSLQMHFGLTMSNLSIYLRFGRRIIVEVLQDDEYAKIAIPSEEKIRQYSQAIKSLYPCLDDVWASMDGLKTLIQKAGSTQQQAYFYNGWKHNHFVTSVFCFCPDGTIPIAFMNLPGATHDSTIADLGGIYSKLESVFMAYGVRCTVDSAFRVRDAPYLLKSSQNNITGDGATLEEIRHDIAIKRAATSVRQSSEWGMRAIQSSFPRMCDRMAYEKKGERRIALKMMILLYNMRARMVGINQIRNVFMPGLNLNAQTAFN